MKNEVHEKEPSTLSRKLVVVAALAAGASVVLAGCSSGSVRTEPHPARPVTLADARRCPVTIGQPVPSRLWWHTLLFGYGSAYGDRSLWVGGLWPHGVIIMTRDDVGPHGQLSMKFGWYRLASGYLRIAGRRLDAPAPPASGLTFPGSYGLTGFNASGVVFPTEGCWQVTGRVGRFALTFVTFVIKGHCDANGGPGGCVAGRLR
jgi:hypothetical protein